MEAHAGDESILERFAEVKHNLIDTCNGQAFLEALEFSLVEDRLEELERLLERLGENEIFVAVVGVQGVGKSTLLNSLIFDRRILPVDVTETTAILTKIYGCQDGDEYADVIFQDGKIQRLKELTSDQLGEFVHHQHNPDNAKAVQELRCYVNSPLLKQGICLVDTPGVESLSTKNGQVTIDFLPRVSAAMFVTMTAPPLTASEVTFLRLVRDYFDNFFFIQNIWNESDREIADATKFIRDTLLKIDREGSEDVNRPAVKPRKVYRIDIHGAMEAKSNQRSEELQASGLVDLLSDLSSFLESGPIRITLLHFIRSFEGLIEDALRSLRARRIALANEGRDFVGLAKEREEKVSEQLDDLDDRWREEERAFLDDVRNACTKAQKGLSSGLMSLSRRVMSEVDQGLSAKHVADSFPIKLETEMRLHLGPWQAEMKDRVKRFEAFFERTLQDFKGLRDNVTRFIDPTSLLDKERLSDASDWELRGKFAEIPVWLGSVGLGILAFEAIGAWWGGAAVVAALGGPAGWIVAGGVLVAGVLVKNWLRDKTKERLRKALDEAIGKAGQQVHDKLDSSEQELRTVADLMREYLDQQIEQLRWELKKIRNDLYTSHEDRDKIRLTINQAEEKLDEARTEVREEVAKCLTAE